MTSIGEGGGLRKKNRDTTKYITQRSLYKIDDKGRVGLKMSKWRLHNMSMSLKALPIFLLTM
jgi:hypothetical protein